MSLTEQQISELVTNIESGDESDWYDNVDDSSSDSEVEGNLSDSLRKNIFNILNEKHSTASSTVNIDDMPIVCEDNVVIPPEILPRTTSDRQLPIIPPKKCTVEVFSDKWIFDKTSLSNFQPKHFLFDSLNSGSMLEDIPENFKEIDIFKAFFDEHFVDHIVEQTNKYFKFIIINFTLKKKSKLQYWKDTNCNEMYTFLAVCLLMAHVKKNKIKDYWSTSFLLSTPAFGQLMSQNRFLLILRLLHFNDNFNQIPGDRIYKIKPVIETLRKKFKNSFSPGQKMCIDESIEE